MELYSPPISFIANSPQKMLISVVDSLANGFETRSDAQRPAASSAPATDIPKPHRQKDESMHADADISGDRA